MRRKVYAMMALALGLAACSPKAKMVEVDHRVRGKTVYVLSDPGGTISVRQREIARMEAQGTSVAIGRNAICMSACTMYLGMRNTCVHPQAQLYFHGPYIKPEDGPPLSPEEFESWSLEIAEYYPPGLDRWFMETGRHKQYEDFYLIRGKDIIKTYGIPACRT